MSGLEGTDAASAAVQAPGTFRVSLDDLKARVADVEYVVRGVLTVAILRLDNGWWLVGRSAPVDPDNFDAEHGQHLAYEDALRQLWPLMAFAHLDR